MWPIAEPSCSSYEPAELQKLKEKLAHLSCKCSSCDKSKAPSTVIVIAQNDKQVQVKEPKNGSFDQFTQVSPDTMTKDQNFFMNTVTKDVLCPSCFVTMNLLRGGLLRVLKDEESETRTEMFGCDKCSGKQVKAMEKATSFTSKPVVKFSNLTLCDFISECSSSGDLSLNVREQGRSRNQVKFTEIGVKERQEVPLNGACLCLENFIDSIRPPFNFTS